MEIYNLTFEEYKSKSMHDQYSLIDSQVTPEITKFRRKIKSKPEDGWLHQAANAIHSRHATPQTKKFAKEAIASLDMPIYTKGYDRYDGGYVEAFSAWVTTNALAAIQILNIYKDYAEFASVEAVYTPRSDEKKYFKDMKYKTRKTLVMVALPHELPKYETMEDVEIKKGNMVFGIYTYKHSVMGNFGWLHRFENRNFQAVVIDNRGAIL